MSRWNKFVKSVIKGGGYSNLLSSSKSIRGSLFLQLQEDCEESKNINKWQAKIPKELLRISAPRLPGLVTRHSSKRIETSLTTQMLMVRVDVQN